VRGKWNSNVKADRITFIPDASWIDGDYQLEIEIRLENLSGNNLNRPFAIKK